MKTNTVLLVVLLFASLAAGTAFAADTDPVLASYLKVSEALAKDDLSGAQKSASELADKSETAKNDALAAHSRELAKSDSLAKAREYFKAVSNEAIKLASGKEGYYVLTCPMAKADWLQTSKEVANPYMGSAMLGCGAVKGE